MPTSDTGQNRQLSQSSEHNTSSSQPDSSGPQRTVSTTRAARIDNASKPTKKPPNQQPGRFRSVSASIIPTSQPGADLEPVPYEATEAIGSSGQRTPRAHSPITASTIPATPSPVLAPVASQISTFSQVGSNYTSPRSTQLSLASNESLGSEAIRATETIENSLLSNDWARGNRVPASPAASFHSLPSQFPPEREYSQEDLANYPSLRFVEALQLTIKAQDSMVPESLRIEYTLDTFEDRLSHLVRDLTHERSRSPDAGKFVNRIFSIFTRIKDEYMQNTEPITDFDQEMQETHEDPLRERLLAMDWTRPVGGPGALQQDPLQGILSSIQDINRNFATVNRRLSALESPRTRNNTSQPPAPNQQNSQSSFAAAAARGKNQTSGATPVAAPSPAAGAATTPKNKGKPDLVRFTIQMREPIPVPERLPEYVIYEKIRPLVDQRSNSIGGKLMEVKWNAQGNLVLAFSHSTNPAAILSIEGEIRSTLRLKGAGDLRRAVPWGKVSLSTVATGVYRSEDTPHSKEALLYELYYCNPLLKNYVITQGPDWTVHPSKIKSAQASISFAFEDKDGKLLPQLLKTDIRMWGKSVRVRKWNNKPLLKRCDRCISYDHSTNTCTRRIRCGRCGNAHPTEKHDDQCSKCKGVGKVNNTPCSHPDKCPLCKDSLIPHAFGSPECPERAKYRVPVSSILHRSSEEAMQHE